MLVIDFLIPILICYIIRSNLINLLLLLIWVTYITIVYIFNDISIMGNLNTLMSLLTNTAVNYYILLISLLIWTTYGRFFNKLSFIVLISITYITVFILNLLSVSFINITIPKSLINLDLFNGILSIHPFILLLSFSTTLYILLTLTSYQLFVSNSFLHICDRPIKLITYKFKLSKVVLKVRLLGFIVLYLNIFSIILGGYWAHQELSWGGYWSWDPIEIFSLIILMLILLLSHSTKTINSFNILILLVLILLIVISLVRLNAVSSIHGFLDINDLRFSLTTFTLLLTIPLLLWFMTYFNENRYTYPIFYLKNLKYSKMLVIGLNTLFLTYSVFYIVSILLSNSIKPINYTQFILFVLFFISICILRKSSSLFFILPILEASTLSTAFNNFRFYFLPKLTHFLIIILLIFFVNLSHVFFININELDYYSVTYGTNNKLLVLSSLYSYYFNNNISCETSNINCSYSNNSYIDIVYPISTNTPLSVLKSNIEQFSTYIFKGLDYVCFGSNLFTKITNTYPLFAISSIWLVSYSLVNKNKKQYIF